MAYRKTGIQISSKDDIKAYYKEYRKVTKEDYKRRRKKYGDKNRERCLEKAKEQYKNDPVLRAKRAAYNKGYYQKNKNKYKDKIEIKEVSIVVDIEEKLLKRGGTLKEFIELNDVDYIEVIKADNWNEDFSVFTCNKSKIFL